MLVCYFLLIVAPLLVNSQRLPSDSKPTAYYLKLDLVPDLATTTTFSGHIQITVNVVSPTYQLVLHARDLDVNSSSVSLRKQSPFAPGGWSTETVSSVDTAGDWLTITFQQQVASGDGYQLTMEYQGRFQNTMAGFAKVEYHYRKTPKYLGVTKFEPTNARSVFPCFDEPQHRTNFILEVTVNKSQHVLSNVRPTTIYNVSETTEMFRFDSYIAMPVYQLGWAVLEQATYMTHTDNSTTTLIHTRAPYPYSNHTTWASGLTALLLEAVGNYTGLNYPLPKLEQVVVPEFFTGTAEGWGIVSYSEEAILVTPDRTSARDTQGVALGLSRGLIQQWFGDLVSIEYWDDLWLIKGFAEYLKFTTSASISGMSSWELNEQVVVELVQPALASDMSQHTLTVDTQNNATLIQEVYDDLTTYKGGAVIKMLHNILGDDVFVRALKFYLNMSVNTTIEPSSLWNIMYEAARAASVDLAMKSVTEIMTPWTTVPGYPVLNVTWNGTHYNISQGESSSWYVPVSYSLQGSPGTVNKAWLHPAGTLLVPASGTQWILLNINQTGLYRVNYEPALWHLLSQQLTTDMTVLSRLSRAQLIDDVFGLMNRGALSSDFVLEFTGFLEAETDYYPWYTALTNFQGLLDKLYGHSSYELLQTRLLKLMTKVITEVGMVAKPQDSHTDKLRRVLVLEKACALGHSTCQLRASSILRSWMASTYYDPDLSTGLLCAGVSNSSAGVWRSVWNMYQYSVYPSVRASILRALTCTTDQALLKEFLTNVTSTSAPVVSSKDKTILLQTIASRSSGAGLLLDWLLETLNAQMNTTTTNSTESSNSTQSSNSTESTNSTQSSNMTSSDASVETNAMPLNEESVVQVSSSSGEDKMQLSSEESTGVLVRKARAATTADTLPEDDVAAILSYIISKLTTLEQGTKLDSFAAQNNTGLSNATLQLMKSATLQVYTNAQWASSQNAAITTWLEQQASATTGVPSGSNSTVLLTSTQGAPSGASSSHSSLVLSLLAAVPVLTFLL